MSAYSSASGGALIKPPIQPKKPKKDKGPWWAWRSQGSLLHGIPPSPFLKSVFGYRTKGAGQPCGPGETSRTGCIPKSGNDSSASDGRPQGGSGAAPGMEQLNIGSGGRGVPQPFDPQELEQAAQMALQEIRSALKQTEIPPLVRRVVDKIKDQVVQLLGEDADAIFKAAAISIPVPSQDSKPVTLALALLVSEVNQGEVESEERHAKSLFYLGFKGIADPVVKAPSVLPSTAPSVAQIPKTQVGASHPPGQPFKGPSGRWFVVRPEDHRTIPSPAPGGEEQGQDIQGKQEEVSGRKLKQDEEKRYNDADEMILKSKKGKLSDYERTALAFDLFALSTDRLKELRDKHQLKAEENIKANLIKAINERVRDMPVEEEHESERGSGGGPAPEEPGEAGRDVEEEAGGSPAEAPIRAGEAEAEPPGAKVAGRVPASQEEVIGKIDRYEKLFRARGHHEQADWMGMLKSHVEEVGTDEALASLGEEVAEQEGSDREVLYEGGVGWHDMNEFMQSYLNRHGIVSVHQGETITPDRRSVSSLTKEETRKRGRGKEGDFKPQDPGWGVDKLKEAQNLPGLEKSEDLAKLMGNKIGDAVTYFTPEVLAKLDEVYGKGGWVVKPYGHEGFAGRGIFFPQRIDNLPQEARNVLWESGKKLAQYGFHHLRDENGRVIGIKHSNGDEYKFGTEKYENTIQGDAREWADEAEAVAGNEHRVELPFGGTYFMAQSAFPVVGISEEERARGVTIKKGSEGRTHIVTRNGKAEWIPHSTWMKEESLPVVFESDDTRAMAQAAVDAINALPESERSGQTYAPDIVKTANGFKVLEANPSAKGGGSGYLEDNPFIIDSYVSHLTGREPAHVKFIRNLLTKRKKGEKRLQQGMKKLVIPPSPFLSSARYYLGRVLI